MKLLLVVLSLTAVSSSWAQSASICGADTPHLNFCQRMKHLRTGVNALDSQPALMQVNYSYLQGTAADLTKNTQILITLLPSGLADHKPTLTKLSETALLLQQQASNQNPEALITANQINSQCMTCHSKPGSTSPVVWNDLFGNGWDKISKECSREGANPYLCKTMNGLMTNFNHIVTGYVAKTEDYDSLVTSATEILRLLGDLGQKKFTHITETLRVSAADETAAVIKMAQQKDPMVFERARNLNNACMQCHNQPSAAPRHLTDIKLFQ